MPTTSAFFPARTGLWGWGMLLGLSQDRARMARDHELLIGWDHPGRDAARFGGDAWPVRCVRFRVELDAEPSCLAAHALADCDGALANAGGEDDRVQAAERRGEGAKLAPDAVNKEIHRQLGARLRGFEQNAHVARDARYAEQARLLVDQFLKRARVHAALVHEVEKHAWVDGAAARAHRQAIDRGEAHGARHAAAGVQRAHACPVAEVQDDAAAARRLRIELRQG